MSKQSKPAEMWVVYNKHGLAIQFGYTRNHAIDNMRRANRIVWSNLYRRGFRCVKVTVTPKEPQK